MAIIVISNYSKNFSIIYNFYSKFLNPSSLSQSMKNQWYGGMLAEDSSDEDQDTIKVLLHLTLNSVLVNKSLI